tara:strand:- start:1025 stop:1165 length:141 start_codon:yes stop_codon:yes gene_type:complete
MLPFRRFAELEFGAAVFSYRSSLHLAPDVTSCEGIRDAVFGQRSYN